MRYPNGIDDEFFYQKGAPPSCPKPALDWLANLACLELHPHPVRTDDLDHPDELPIDLNPTWADDQSVSFPSPLQWSPAACCSWASASWSEGNISILSRRSPRAWAPVLVT